MLERDTDRLLPNREHYRELARQVCEEARLARCPLCPKRAYSALLTASFDYRARHLGRYED